jgi:hypothetical protein
MKRNLLLLNYILAITALLCFLAPLDLYSAPPSKDQKITVMNPAVREILAERVNLTPRLKNLEGKTIYLVDMNYEGINGTPVMGEIQTWFKENMPTVKTILRVKKGNYIEDDPALWKEIADNGGDAVIMGVAG